MATILPQRYNQLQMVQIIPVVLEKIWS